ncbi:MAG: malate dehydrogenase [Gammaproteobacteria bacterium]|jgi:malate dehydrogenase (oxaloacetate-decarboxylating)|nr:malate dehydrogenase [Gammaproteobacteria bacterium]
MKRNYDKIKDQDGKVYYEVKQAGYNLLRSPTLNKGSAFPADEREAFGLVGLLPPCESDIETQIKRTYQTFLSKVNDIEKHIYLRGVQDSNETLFYAVVNRYITEMMPIVYTPVVGQACQKFSHIYRYPRGLYLAYPYRDRIEEILADEWFDRVEVIVVSDGERILGLGDQGVGGMGIPIGKLSLYTACAGIDPITTLPILLDTGTNNVDLLDDPLYMGWRHERVRGKEYDDFIELFVKAVKKRWPHVLLQWEDFAQINANPILARYKDQLCTFNDDIQGTASVAAGTLLAAMRVTGTSLKDQKICLFGAGSAGCGISELLVHILMEEGLSEKEARSHFYLVDRNGLLLEGMQGLQSFQEPFKQSLSKIADWQCDKNMISLMDVVKNAHPTVLIGVSGQAGLFSEEIVREMATHTHRPIIFPLSNPTSKAEANPADLLKWTEGRALVGTGSPFPDTIKNGKACRIDQTNNAYIFPGLGLGAVAAKLPRISNEMFMAAAKALADCSPAKNNPEANLLPPLTDIREISMRIAIAVLKQAIKEGHMPEMSDEKMLHMLLEKIWRPEYVSYKKV